MCRTRLSLCAAAMAVLSIALYGCGANVTSNQASSPADSSTSAHTEHAKMEPAIHAGHAEHGDGHAEHSGGHANSDMEAMKAGLAELAAADRASAEKQHVCPVSGEMLGTMGTPQKVDIDGQQVWICCPGCKDQLLASPEQYLAKLTQ